MSLVPTKSIFSSKTFWFNAATVAIGVSELSNWSNLLTSTQLELMATAVGVINVILRVLTVQPVHVTTPQKVQSPPAA